MTSAGIAEAFRSAGVNAAVEIVTGGAMADRARAALQSGVDAVVAGGGDGSVRCIAGVLAGTRTPLGVLPLGTLNHFARDLGIPADLEGAARAIAAGCVRALDVGEVNGQVFVNTSCLGFYPPVVRERDRQRTHLGRGKWLAAASALLTVLPRVHALSLSFSVDGQTLRRTTRFVFVGNNEYRMHLFTQGEREIFDSGDLYLYIVNRPSRLLLLRLALLALVKDAATAESFESFRVSAFSIEERTKRRRPILVFLDGEVVRLDPPLRYRVRPRDLLVLAPPAAGERA